MELIANTAPAVNLRCQALCCLCLHVRIEVCNYLVDFVWCSILRNIRIALINNTGHWVLLIPYTRFCNQIIARIISRESCESLTDSIHTAVLDSSVTHRTNLRQHVCLTQILVSSRSHNRASDITLRVSLLSNVAISIFCSSLIILSQRHIPVEHIRHMTVKLSADKTILIVSINRILGSSLHLIPIVLNSTLLDALHLRF